MKVSIILPYFNMWQLTHARMMELFKHAPLDTEIVMVNDASTDSDCRTGAGWWQQRAGRHEIKYVENKENLGFGGSHNVGASVATGDILCFLSNDVVVRTNFIDNMVGALVETPYSLLGGEIIYYPGGWNEFEFENKKMVVPYCNGWLLACTREVWDNLGGFDVETFGKFDFEDIDLSMNALSHGYDLLSLNLPKHQLHHLSGVTIRSLNIDRMNITKINREKFIAKWKSKFNDVYETLERMKDDGSEANN